MASTSAADRHVKWQTVAAMVAALAAIVTAAVGVHQEWPWVTRLVPSLGTASNSGVDHDDFVLTPSTTCSRESRRVGCTFTVQNKGDRRVFNLVGGSRTFLIDDRGANLAVTGASVPGAPSWNAGSEGAGLHPPRLETVVPAGSSATLTLYFSDVGNVIKEITVFARWNDVPQPGTSRRSGENIYLFEKLNIPVK